MVKARYPACGSGGGGDGRTIGDCRPGGAERTGLTNPDPEATIGAVVVAATWYSAPVFWGFTDSAQAGI